MQQISNLTLFVHIITVLSAPPEAKRLPSNEYATVYTASCRHHPSLLVHKMETFQAASYDIVVIFGSFAL